MSEPLAYFLTWTTHGTWVHGDSRGSVDRTNASRFMDFHPPNPLWEQASQRRMTDPPVVLTVDQRPLVEHAIREHSLHKGWEVIEVNCRSNHVHVVVRAAGVGPERVMAQLKAYATRALRAGGRKDLGRTWALHGSTRYLNSQQSLEAAVQYVREQ
jgi:REP element-mobilizing transposase RayT